MKEKTAFEVFGEALTRARVGAHLSTQQLATKLGKPKSRPYVEEIEAGRKNVTFTQFEKMIKACNTSVEKALSGVSKSDLPKDSDHLYWMLGVIAESGRENIIEAVKVHLQALSEKILRDAWREANPETKTPADLTSEQKNNIAPNEKKKRKTAEG